MLAAGVICFVNLGVTGLWDLDEALYSSIAREMSVRGDWVVPTFNTGVFYDKPPLMFWLMMGSFKLLGEQRVFRTPARGDPGDWHLPWRPITWHGGCSRRKSVFGPDW